MEAEKNGSVPRSIGKYQILARIARGGMAEVFLGRAKGEAGFERLVAVKRILPHLAANVDFVSMFADEARISAELHHGNIGQVFDFGRVDDTYFIAMEYIQGVDLQGIYRFFGRLETLPPHPMVAFVVANVCAALEYAHTRSDSQDDPLNIIHRDVSPSNVLATFEGEIKLIDFGIAKATQRLHETSGETLKGKFSYMSPEQAYGKPLDHRSDIFGTGILLYELLTGQNPFSSESDLGTLENVRQAKVPPLSSIAGDIPKDLEQICLRALSREPEDRFASADEIQVELEKHCFKAAYGRRQLGEWMKESFAEELEKTRRFLGQLREAPAAKPDEAKTKVFQRWLAGEKKESLSKARTIRQEARPSPKPEVLKVDTTTTLSSGEKPELSNVEHPPSRMKWLAMGVVGSLGIVVVVTFFLKGEPEPVDGTGTMVRVPAIVKDKQAHARGVLLPASRPATPADARIPRMYTVTVDTDATGVECRAAIEGKIPQPGPCRFRVEDGKTLQVVVYLAGRRLHTETWKVTKDRVLKLDQLRKTEPTVRTKSTARRSPAKAARPRKGSMTKTAAGSSPAGRTKKTSTGAGPKGKPSSKREPPSAKKKATAKDPEDLEW